MLEEQINKLVFFVAERITILSGSLKRRIINGSDVKKTTKLVIILERSCLHCVVLST